MVVVLHGDGRRCVRRHTDDADAGAVIGIRDGFVDNDADDIAVLAGGAVDATAVDSRRRRTRRCTVYVTGDAATKCVRMAVAKVVADAHGFSLCLINRLE